MESSSEDFRYTNSGGALGHPMNDKEFINHLKHLQPELEKLINRTLPVKIGARAKALFQENFRKGGFQDGGLQAWKVTRRQLTGKGADAGRGPLLSSRQVLYKSISYSPERGSVTIYSRVKYAAIHNEGGTVITHPRITPKMRRFAWAKFYEAGGGKKGQKGQETGDAAMWKAMALTKKTTLTIKSRIPRRRFIGPSRELNSAVETIITTEVGKIIRP